MDKDNHDIFEIRNSDSTEILSENHQGKKGMNFFLSEGAPLLKSSTEPIRRLNDYDFNLLKEDAYKDVSDDIFKLEYKISKTAEEIKMVETQIETADEIKDSVLIKELKARLITLREDYETLIGMYNEKSVSAKITIGLSSIFEGKFKSGIDCIKEIISKTSEGLVSKLPKSITSVFELKKSLNTLENINKSVDELIKMKIPYGEQRDKYETLSKYIIIKANSIHCEISKNIKK